jgi:hypothetical protein
MTHDAIDKRSLAFDALIAGKVERDPGLIDIARENVERWLTSCSSAARPALLEWKKILAPDREVKKRVLRILEGEDGRSRWLRQSSPFAGPRIITPAERQTIVVGHKR